MKGIAKKTEVEVVVGFYKSRKDALTRLNLIIGQCCQGLRARGCPTIRIMEGRQYSPCGSHEGKSEGSYIPRMTPATLWGNFSESGMASMQVLLSSINRAKLD